MVGVMLRGGGTTLGPARRGHASERAALAGPGGSKSFHQFETRSISFAIISDTVHRIEYGQRSGRVRRFRLRLAVIMLGLREMARSLDSSLPARGRPSELGHLQLDCNSDGLTESKTTATAGELLGDERIRLDEAHDTSQECAEQFTSGQSIDDIMPWSASGGPSAIVIVQHSPRAGKPCISASTRRCSLVGSLSRANRRPKASGLASISPLYLAACPSKLKSSARSSLGAGVVARIIAILERLVVDVYIRPV